MSGPTMGLQDPLDLATRATAQGSQLTVTHSTRLPRTPGTHGGTGLRDSLRQKAHAGAERASWTGGPLRDAPLKARRGQPHQDGRRVLPEGPAQCKGPGETSFTLRDEAGGRGAGQEPGAVEESALCVWRGPDLGSLEAAQHQALRPTHRVLGQRPSRQGEKELLPQWVGGPRAPWPWRGPVSTGLRAPGGI